MGKSSLKNVEEEHIQFVHRRICFMSTVSLLIRVVCGLICVSHSIGSAFHSLAELVDLRFNTFPNHLLLPESNHRRADNIS